MSHKAAIGKKTRFKVGQKHPRRRRRQVVPRQAGAYKREEVLAAAEQGVEAEDLAHTLGLVERLQDDAELRKAFEETVALGHARMRSAASRRLYDEGVGKGKPSALIELAKRWLPRYGETLTPEEVQGTTARAMEFVKQFKQREAEDAS